MSPAPRNAVYDAIADPTRRRILEALGDGARPVHRIAEGFDISRPAISKHLRILSEAGLVRAERRGRTNVYALDRAPFEEVRTWLDRFWAGRLDTLRRLAEGDA